MTPNTKDKWIRRFLITETSRHKRGFTVYKVTSVIYPRSAPEAVSRVSIWKRYNEFRKLHLELSGRHNSLRIKEAFPDFPKPKFFGRFEAEVIEERRQCAVKLLEFIARHTALFTSDVFVKFFESGHSIESITQDCSLSLSSDTSEDDYKDKINYDIEGTDYKRASIYQIEDNGDHNNPDASNKVNGHLNIDKHFTTHPELNGEIISSKTFDNYNQSLTRNNNCDEDVVNTRKLESSYGEERLCLSTDYNSLTQIDNYHINDGSDLPNEAGAEFAGYIIVAAAHMSAAFRHEAIGEFGEAFTQYKLGISKLLDGVQEDPDLGRRVTVKGKISKYLERAEKLYNRHLNCNISVLSKSQDELKYYKVLRVIGNVMLVRDTQRDCNRVIKTVQKPAGNAECLSDYILRGKIPFMVRLYGCIETDSTIFLVLQYASGGKLWEYMKSYYKGRNNVSNWREKSHTRSVSCEAIIQKSEITASELSKVENISSEIKIETNGYETALDYEDNNVVDPEESLKRLEEEFGANSASRKIFPTTDLLAKSQELLRSVDATLKKSSSIASKLNESGNLIYCKNKSDSNLKDNIKARNNEEINETNRNKIPKSLKGDSLEKMEKVEKLDKSEITELEKMNKVLSNSEENLNISDTATNSSEHLCSIESEKSLITNSDSENKETKKLSSPKSKEGISSLDQFQYLVSEDSGIEMDDELWKLPEGTIRFWAAEILVALESLHRQDVIVGDLKPDNILLGSGGHVAITYIVPRSNLQFLNLKKPYSAPELCVFSPTVNPTTAVDIWSYGVLLYELFTGIQFQSKHPGPFHSHSILDIPEELSSNVKSLISNILRYKPEERLTICEIKEHPFFTSIDWASLVNSCFT